MIFNSIEFAIFFPIVFILYWCLFKKNINLRNIFLIGASYFFYGWWDWRFLSLIIASSFVDFFLGKRIYAEEKTGKRKLLLSISLVINLGFLGFFKYFNFFVDSFAHAFTIIGKHPEFSTLKIILPVGISFYTFQTLSYTLDIYKGKMKPVNDIFGFFAFVSFFPQLVAGPIERAKHLLPQFYEVKKINYESLKSGLLLITWGLFKKIVIADRLAVYIDNAYADIDNINGIPAVVAVLFFAFQLYLDFSAYSDIAIGSARTLGFNLSLNFKRPYLSESFSDFWKRWHISLSSWFKDYLYIPLGGSKHSKWITHRNILIVFLLSGLWHGASWNFVIWGVLNAIFLIFIDSAIKTFNEKGIQRILKSTIVNSCWALSLVFFRGQTFSEAKAMYGNLGFGNATSIYNYGLGQGEFKFAMFLVLFVIIIEIIQERTPSFYKLFSTRHFVIRWTAYTIILLTIVFLGAYGIGLNDNNFIYFQF